MESVARAVAEAAERLRMVGIESPFLDARLLAQEILRMTPEEMIAHPERDVSPLDATRLDALVKRRMAREPVAYLLGRREFWGWNC